MQAQRMLYRPQYIMRNFKFILAFLCLFVSAPSYAAWTHVQHTTTQDVTGTTNTTWSVTLGAGVSANSAVSGQFIFDNTGGATVSSIKSDKGDTATIVDTNSDPGNEGSVSFAFAGLTSGATTITATLSIAASYIAFSVDEDNPGVGFIPALDGHNTNLQTATANGTNAITTGAFTPATNGDLIKAFAINSSGECNYAAGTSPNAFTARNNVLGASGHFSIISEDFIQTTAASITPTIGLTNIGANVNTLSFGMGFKVVASGGTTRRLRSLMGVGQ